MRRALVHQRSRPLTSDSAGFTLVELAVVLIVVGIVVAISAPAFKSFLDTSRLRGATQNVAAQVLMARERALATGVGQPIHFALDSASAGDYHVHTDGLTRGFDLPLGITYGTGTTAGFTMKQDGRASASGLIVLVNRNGVRDTVSVLTSGMVLQ